MIQPFKKIVRVELAFYAVVMILGLLTSCKEQKTSKDLAHNVDKRSEISLPLEAKEPSPEFKNYWYAGEAEVSSYQLEQARYGEIRKGHAVLIYVTEDFLPEEQVKADRHHTSNVSVLKLNTTKKFFTGIYPYSIMQSTFFPVSNDDHAIKISSSMQEWCGHVYAQLNNRDAFEVTSHSYFEGEADKSFSLSKAVLENELWTQLRIDPKSLPTGHLNIIPSFEYCRLRHVPIKAYKAEATLNGNSYSISYPKLHRTLTINFNVSFPHDILGWEEVFKSGFGPNAKSLTTKASKLKTIKSAYWGKNSNKDEILRKELLLK